MNIKNIRKYSLMNIRISTFVILACYIYTIANGEGVYSDLSVPVLFIVLLSLFVIVISMVLLVTLFIINKKNKGRS